MKLKHAHIENFKGVKDLTIDFTSPSSAQPRRLTCLIGDNGSGKTTVLQAIALPLSLATLKLRHPAEFDWFGFLAERISSLGRTRVQLVVVLDQEEVRLTSELYGQWQSLPNQALFHRLTVPPTEHHEVTLVYDDGELKSPQGDGAINQLMGRFCARSLARVHSEKAKLLSNLGDVFWFDQYRDLRPPAISSDEKYFGRTEKENWKAGVEHLRESLFSWWAYHTGRRLDGRDYVAELERNFARIFPGTQFRGIQPRQTTAAPQSWKDFYFLLERDGKVYDIAEMASGEQAVFPLLYEFVRLDVGKSIVLLDELEMHLHPPQQQAVLSALQRIGPDCQFIITTHSSEVADTIPADEEVRLPGGRRCL